MNENFAKVREIITDIIERRWINTTPGTKDDFIKIVFGIRYLVSFNKNQLSAIWNGIRIDPVLTDFVLDVTREFLLRSFDDTYSYQKLCSEIATTVGYIADIDTSIDKDLTGNIVPENTVKAALLSNPWFTLLYICEGLIVMEKGDE